MLAAAEVAHRGLDPVLSVGSAVLGAQAVIAGGLLAATDALDTGVVVGAAGMLVFLFRYWFSETKRKDQGVWEIADEYRVERDYHSIRADHWQARWVALVQGKPEADGPPHPNLEQMRAAAQRDKEADRGRRR